jgi:hypothetical protein
MIQPVNPVIRPSLVEDISIPIVLILPDEYPEVAHFVTNFPISPSMPSATTCFLDAHYVQLYILS